MARWAGSRITLFSQRILIAADCFALLCFALLLHSAIKTKTDFLF